ncbi:12215_t:CDS:1, partial [Funneliformis geosporum]
KQQKVDSFLNHLNSSTDEQIKENIEDIVGNQGEEENNEESLNNNNENIQINLNEQF